LQIQAASDRTGRGGFSALRELGRNPAGGSVFIIVSFVRIRPMAGAARILRPFAWLAAFGFLVGFFGYLAVSPPAQAVAQADHGPSLTSGPASEDWNLPHHI
jgi:hypothetical protein